MKKIKLNTGEFTLVDDDDFLIYGNMKWFVNSDGYPKNHSGPRKTRKSKSLHRLIMKAQKGETVDHINRNKLDNRKCNLRIVPQQKQCFNRSLSKHNKTGYKGVGFNKRLNKYIAQICKDYKTYHLGVFETKEEAAKVYDENAIKLFGEYASTNKMLGLIK